MSGRDDERRRAIPGGLLTPDGCLESFPSGAWRLRLKSLAKMRGALGEDLAVALCRCHVHANRLLSLAHYRALLREQLKKSAQPAGVERAKGSIVWLEVGIMRELARGIGALNKAVAARRWRNLDGLASLVALQKRWDQKGQLRNQGAFHVDDAPIREGLRRLNQSAAAVVVEGDSEEHFRSWFPLADGALMTGLQTQAEADELTKLLRADREAAVRDLVVVFQAALRRGGIVLEPAAPAGR
jgi:hypothetical protein